MGSDLWFGALLSIPIGIGTAMVTPILVEKWSKVSTHAAIAKSKKTDDEYRRIYTFKEDRTSLTQYLVVTTIMTSITSALTALLAGFFVFLNADLIVRNLPSFIGVDVYRLILQMLITVTLLFGAVLIINFCRPALSAWIKVSNFPEYERSAKLSLGSIGGGVTSVHPGETTGQD